jgi:signal transduction histidine kinase
VSSASTSAGGRLRGQELLRAVAEGTAGAVGEEFLRCLVRHVADALAAKMVMVAEATDPTGSHVRIVACWLDGRHVDEPFEYDTAGTPCSLAPGETVVAVPDQLTSRFPEDRDLIEAGLESYLGVCLRASDGTHLGHLAVLDADRFDAGDEDVAALRIFAARAAAELERRNQAAALAASRARVVAAADAERRRVGRNLHDGAQQRLLAVSNLLRVARRQVGENGAEALLAQAEEELATAHAELRELARGLHPVALSERGLPAALESLTAACAIPVALEVCDDALPDEVATAAYFVVAEALANAARHADASSARVRVGVLGAGGVVEVEVADDGRGGADVSAGTGLRGLADRVEVLGGRLEVHSPAGGGTRVVARLPVAA